MAEPHQLRDHSSLLDAYLSARDRPGPHFNIPGHKGRAGDLDPGLGRLLEGDVPQFGGLEDMQLSSGLVAKAERRVAEYYGADWCRFSVGGTSHTNIAGCLAVRSLGERVVAARNLHKSMLMGMVMADLTPVWLTPTIDPVLGLPMGLDPADVGTALDRQPAAAVLLTEPSYVGTVGELAATAEIAHQQDAAVVVDQAWGAHFGFGGGVGEHALALGADLVTSSTHKTLAGYSQASLILASAERCDPGRLDAAFEMQHTTSPAGSILASIEASVVLLAERGPEVLERLVTRLDALRAQLRDAVPGLDFADAQTIAPERVDPTKLVVLLAGTGADGTRVAADLAAGGMVIEYATRDLLIPIVTVFDDDATVDQLCRALARTIADHTGPPRTHRIDPVWTLQAEVALTPRQAFFAPHETVPFVDAVGRVSQELAAVYPPGVAVLVPGEVVAAEAIETLRQAGPDGRRVAYLHDPTLTTIRVVR